MTVILDLDGTLIDSRERHYRLMKEILSEKAALSGFNASDFMKYKADGNSGKQYLINCLHLPEEEAGEIMSLWQERIEEERLLELDVLYPDTIAFLEQLKKNRDTIFYLTARQNKEGVLREVRRLKIDGYANEIRVVSPGNALEEKKAFALSLAARKDVDTKCHIIGDTENEYRLAKELSLSYSILNRGFRSKEYWDSQGVESYASLREALESMGKDR